MVEEKNNQPRALCCNKRARAIHRSEGTLVTYPDFPFTWKKAMKNFGHKKRSDKNAFDDGALASCICKRIILWQ